MCSWEAEARGAQSDAARRTRERLLAVCSVGVAAYVGLAVLPVVGEGTVNGVVPLLRSRDAFVQRAGAERCAALARGGGACVAAKLEELGARDALVVVQRGATDEQTRIAAADALAALDAAAAKAT